MRRLSIASSRRRQTGVVLFVAMIVLVVMALAGVAMLRQSNTGLSVAGNLAFKVNATSTGDLGTESALDWWLPKRNTVALDSDDPAEGYYADWGTAVDGRLGGDPTTYKWATMSKKVLVDDGSRAGNEVWYVIERLCEAKDLDPDAAGQMCVKTEPVSGKNQSGTTRNYPKNDAEDRRLIHYRISSRIQGPKGTLSYIQVMVR